MLVSIPGPSTAHGFSAMDKARAVVDGQAICVRDMREALRRVDALIAKGCGFTFFTLNLDHLVKRRESAAFRAAYSAATLVSADGWPVVALARRDDPAVVRTTGADLVEPLCAAAAEAGIPVYFFGTTETVLEGAVAVLKRTCPLLDVRGAAAPPFGFEPGSPDAREAARRIADSGARLCFLALGAPKQELFAEASQAICPGVGFVCVGAALDFLAGAQTRAPKLLQASRLEWAWRFIRQPRRLGRRYFDCGVLFLRLLAARAGKSAR